MEMMTTKASITTGTMTATFADGMTATKAIFRQDWPRKTACLPGWKNNLCGVASFRRGFKNDSNRVLRIWNGSYLRRLLIARTY
jgi:hypothetical protein